MEICRKKVKIENPFLSGPFHLIKLLSFFLSDKCELTADRNNRIRFPAGLRCVFYGLIQLSVYICRIEKRKEFE